MKTLICSEMLLSLITVAMALASSSPRSNFSSSLYHLVMLSLLSRAALTPVLMMCMFSLCFYRTARAKNLDEELKETRDYACPRYSENGNEMERY